MGEELIRRRFEEGAAVKQSLLAPEHVETTRRMAEVVAGALRDGGKVLFCGNGGSAADSMHLAAELVGRYRLERPAMAAIALSDSQAVMTCVANDMAFDQVFARGVRAYGREGDVLVALSTSGGVGQGVPPRGGGGRGASAAGLPGPRRAPAVMASHLSSDQSTTYMVRRRTSSKVAPAASRPVAMLR